MYGITDENKASQAPQSVSGTETAFSRLLIVAIRDDQRWVPIQSTWVSAGAQRDGCPKIGPKNRLRALLTV
jgi:hypothetical protein